MPGGIRAPRRRVLAIGAHPDDVELGAAGTLLRHIAAGDEVTMLSMTAGELGAGSPDDRIEEAQAAAALIGARLLWGPYDDGRIPLTSDTVGFLERVLDTYDIDTMYVHSERDSHQDHVVTTRAAVAAGRRLIRILRYQSPSTESFAPNVYVDISGQLQRKLAALACHHSQLHGSPAVDLDVAAAAATYWGAQARLGSAEAFESSRFTWDVAPLDNAGQQTAQSARLRGGDPSSTARGAWDDWDIIGEFEQAPATGADRGQARTSRPGPTDGRQRRSELPGEAGESTTAGAPRP